MDCAHQPLFSSGCEVRMTEDNQQSPHEASQLPRHSSLEEGVAEEEQSNQSRKNDSEEYSNQSKKNDIETQMETHGNTKNEEPAPEPAPLDISSATKPEVYRVMIFLSLFFFRYCRGTRGLLSDLWLFEWSILSPFFLFSFSSSLLFFSSLLLADSSFSNRWSGSV